eukprot:GILK01005264.1.p1 GENE.GILK01005264.1~~GILK01005264.1.p1  ORF type:complete len:914 (-),score=174.44 GILK01005264.1:34-2406(-)
MENVEKDKMKAQRLSESLHDTPYRRRLLLQAVITRAELEDRVGNFEEAIHCYEQTGWYIHGGSPSGGAAVLKLDAESRSLYETALLRTPELYLKCGNIRFCIAAYRRSLTSPVPISDSTKRQLLIRCGRVLLSTCCGEQYPRWQMPSPDVSMSLYVPQNEAEEAALLFLLCERSATEIFDRKRRLSLPSESAPELKSKAGSKRISVDPKNVSNVPEQDFTLTSPITSSAEEEELLSVYSDLCLAFTRAHHYPMLVEVVERALIYHMDDLSLWIKVALSLVGAKRYKHAVIALKECMKLYKTNFAKTLEETHALIQAPFLPLLAAKICLDNLHKTKDAVELAKIALGEVDRFICGDVDLSLDSTEMRLEVEQHRTLLLAQCHHILGLGYGKLSREVRTFTERQHLQEECIQHLEQAAQLDSSNHLFAFHLALAYAEVRENAKALECIRISLSLHSGQALSWLVLGLLLSARKQYSESIQVVDAGLIEHPDNVLLWLVKAKALATMSLSQPRKESPNISQCAPANCPLSPLPVSDGVGSTTSSNASLWANSALPSELAVMDFNGQESLRTFEHLTQVVLPRLHESVSPIQEEEGDYSSNASGDQTVTIWGQRMASFEEHQELPVPHILTSLDMSRVDVERIVWLEYAEICTYLGMHERANFAIAAAAVFDSIAFESTYQRGILEECKGNPSTAVELFEKVLSVQPNHVPSLVRAASIYSNIQHDFARAHTYLTQALRIDSTCHEAWYQLGLVLASQGSHDKSCDAFLTALDLEQTAPILDVSLISKQITSSR